MSSLKKCLFKSFAHFLIGLLVFLEWSHVSSLYILEIKPLAEVSLANMFSHTVGSLFILILFSLAMQKLFILMRSHVFILSFLSLALADISLKILLHGISEIFLPMFSLVGMQTGATTMENNMEFPQKTKNGTAFLPGNSTARIIS